MGNECKRIGEGSNEGGGIDLESHPAFGDIFRKRGERSRTERAFKKLTGGDARTMEGLRKRVEFAKDSDSIATLVRVLDYDWVEGENQQGQTNEGFGCGTIQQHCLLVHFEYYPPASTLSCILDSKRNELTRVRSKYGQPLIVQAGRVRLCDYDQIDRLQSHLRQLVNINYQQIEIVRMIDHLIGAVYFLHHYQLPHGAVRPQHVVVDQEGRYVLVDAQVFGRLSNYEAALEGEYEFLVPEALQYLKHRVAVPGYETDKADIYCVGMMALNMCLLERRETVFEYDLTQKCVIFREGELAKRLVKAQQRYSEQLVELLDRMLQKDPHQRIDFPELIDELNPLLARNLQSIKRLHSLPTAQPTPIQSPLASSRAGQELRERLLGMQQQFQRVMNNRTMLLSRQINQKELRNQQEKILKKLATIKTTRSAFTTTARQTARANPEHPPAPTVTQFVPNPPPQSKRYISGKDLQLIVWQEYQNLKQKRNTPK